MNLSSLTRPFVAIVPAVCLVLFLGMGWYGYAQINSRQDSGVRVNLAQSGEAANESQLLKAELTVADAESATNDFTPTKHSAIQGGDILAISVNDVLPDSPIRGLYRVEASGKVALGTPYGRVRVGGLDIEEAEHAITTFLREMVNDPKVSVTFDQLPGDAKGPTLQRRGLLQSGEFLRLRVGNGLEFATIFDETVQIDSSGNIALPGLFQRVQAVSRNVEDLEIEVKARFAKRLTEPKVIITRVSGQDTTSNISALESRLAEIERLLTEVNRKLK